MAEGQHPCTLASIAQPSHRFCWDVHPFFGWLLTHPHIQYPPSTITNHAQAPCDPTTAPRLPEARP